MDNPLICSYEFPQVVETVVQQDAKKTKNLSTKPDFHHKFLVGLCQWLNITSAVTLFQISYKVSEFSETPNPAYFYAYFCFCMRKISFRGFSFTLCCHQTSKLNFKDVPRTSEISFIRRNRYLRYPKIVKKPAHF